jgi:hypothetical protein
MKQEVASIFPVNFSSIKLSKKTSQNHQENSMHFNGTFMKNFKFIRGVIGKKNVRNSKENQQNTVYTDYRPKPTCMDTPGSSKSLRGVGLIQIFQNLDPTASRTKEHDKRCVHARVGLIGWYISQNQGKNHTNLTRFSLYNVPRERESANSLFSDLTPVIFNLSPTQWPAVAPPRRSLKPPRSKT